MTKILTLQAQSAASVKVTTKLNDQQLSAIQQLEGVHVINSGAGTGKTATLVARLQRLHEVYPTATVLMLAFSKAAVQELQQRVGAIHGVTISTFHSLAYHVLKSSGWKFSVETSTENQTSAIESLIGRSKTTVEEVIRSLHGVSGASRSTLRVRRQLLSMLKEMPTVTFDTMIIFATGALQKHAGLRNYWQSRYDFVQVDEGQDLNPAQVELLQIVTAETKNLCLSGDPRQQIYGFRGAFGAMEKLSKTAQIHSLTKNYRCNPAILKLANSVMDEYEPLIPASKIVRIPPQFWTALDATDEAKLVANEIERLHEQGQRYSEMAVLYRSTAVTSEIISTLLECKIPFVTKSPLLVKYAQKPWREIIALFKFMTEPTSTDALREILPLFFLKKERIGEVEAMVAEQKCSLLSSLPLLARKAFHRDCIVELATAIETAETFTPSATLRHVVKHGLGNYFGEAMTLSVESAIGELQKFPTIAAFLEQVQSVKDQLAKIKELAAKAKDAVMLSTIHASKGMEWQSVFLIGLVDGVLPSNCNGSDIDEEKRLLYVGITRAKQRLYLSYPRMSDNTVEFNKPCRFLAGHF